jgi:hypothetical protein
MSEIGIAGGGVFFFPVIAAGVGFYIAVIATVLGVFRIRREVRELRAELDPLLALAGGLNGAPGVPRAARGDENRGACRATDCSGVLPAASSRLRPQAGGRTADQLFAK